MAYITLNQYHFIHNLNLIAKHVGSKERIAIVLKDNAYGHGLLEMARLSQIYGLKKAVVRTVAEAKQIASYFQEIIILADIPSEPLEHRFIVTINTLDAIAKIPPLTKVHLKIDSGMHRHGIEPQMLEEAFQAITAQGLKLDGLFTHYRSADILSSELFWQQKRFQEVKQHAKIIAKKYGIDYLRFHASNSAAAMRLNFSHDEDFVRVGIGAYGCLEMPSSYQSPDFKPVLSLWAERIKAYTLFEGERVGYAGRFEASKKVAYATYDVGYSDGMMRGDASKSFTTPYGHTILGAVSMDNCTLDTNEEKVLIFDNANTLAQLHNTIGYEILVRLNPTLKRIVI